MKKLLSIALISVGLGTFASADTFNLHQGWNLVGSSNSVDLSKDFNNSNVSIVWRYENGQWQYYTPSENIKSEIPSKYTFFTKTSPNEGFWVYSKGNMNINIGNANTQNNSSVNNTNNGQNNTITLEKFKKYLADNNLTSIDYDAYNKTYLLGPNQVMVIKEDGSGKYHAYDYNHNEIYKHEHIEATKKLDDNIYILDTEDGKEIYMAIIQNEGNGLIKLAFSTPDGKIGTTDVLTLNGNVQDTTLNNIEDVKTLFEDSNITTVSINDDDIKGTWKDEKGDVLTFDNDGNFSINLAKGGDKEGTYSIEDGGVKIHFDNDGMNIYFVPVKKEDGKIEMYAVFSDSDNTNYNVIFGGEVLNLIKQ